MLFEHLDTVIAFAAMMLLFSTGLRAAEIVDHLPPADARDGASRRPSSGIPGALNDGLHLDFVRVLAQQRHRRSRACGQDRSHRHVHLR